MPLYMVHLYCQFVKFDVNYVFSAFLSKLVSIRKSRILQKDADIGGIYCVLQQFPYTLTCIIV